MVVQKLSKLRVGKVLILDSSQNNPVIAERIDKKKGYWYYPFPIYDKFGNDINPDSIKSEILPNTKDRKHDTKVRKNE